MITKMPGEKRNILKDLPPTERSALIGDIITLMTQSPAHTDYKISHISKIVLPPVHLNQYRIYHNAKKEPVGFVSWAMLSKETEKKFLGGEKPLTIAEWASGDIIYIMEFIAPYGHAQEIIKDLQTRYAGYKAHAVRFSPNRKNGKVVTTFYGEMV